MVKYTIIIPVYNMESTISTCLKSILEQQIHQEYELIIINDGSTDYTAEEIYKVKQTYPTKRIKVLNGEHKGVSVARNLGIQHAIGEYILFVDADDLLTKDALFYIEKGIDQSQHADWLIFESKISASFDNKVFTSNLQVRESIASILCRTPIFKEVDIYQCSPGPVSKLYKREILVNNDIRFNPHLRMGEDIIFNLEYLSYIKNVYFKNCILYQYNESTSSKLFSLNNLENELIFHKKLKKLLKDYHPNILQKMEITGAIFLIKKYYFVYPGWNYQRKLKEMKMFFKHHSYYLKSLDKYSNYSNQIGRYNRIICFLLTHKCYRLLYLLIKYKENY